MTQASVYPNAGDSVRFLTVFLSMVFSSDEHVLQVDDINDANERDCSFLSPGARPPVSQLLRVCRPEPRWQRY